MASAISHVVAAGAIATCYYRPGVSRNIWLLGLACSVLPDLDVIGFGFGVHYGDLWGHRGLTHSVAFAAVLASIIVWLLPRDSAGLGRPGLWAFFFLVTASHGLLDGLTDGGLGVAFWSPFDTGRYFLPWRPIRVSPIGITSFLSARGLAVLRSEAVWVWLPSAALAGAAWLWRARPRVGAV